MISAEDHFDLCEQRRAILGGTGHMLVLGGPGSGKTTIALLRAHKEVRERLSPEQLVLFLSFSNAATRRILEGAGAILSADTMRQIDVRTYHSFAWDLLRSHGYLLSSKRILDVISAQDAAVIRSDFTDAQWPKEQNRLFFHEGRVTFDQFAPRAADLLEQAFALRNRICHAYPLILVDEFQDTDDQQMRLVEVLAQGSDVIALGDTEQRIYAWREGTSTTRLSEFAQSLNALQYDFQNENNRSPATGIAAYARSLLSPGLEQERPEEVRLKPFLPGRFEMNLRFAFFEAWNEATQRAGTNDIKLAVAARNRLMVRRISDALTKPLTVANKTHRPIPHDVMIDHTQIALSARVIAFLIGSPAEPRRIRIAGALDRIGSVFRSAGNKTNIETSDRLRKWADKCRSGDIPKTKCVNALGGVLDYLNTDGLSGRPTEDWLKVLRALDQASADELTRIGEHARHLRLLRRGSAIEEELAALWRQFGTYEGAEEALEAAILQDQMTDSHRPASTVSIMTMHQLKGREYDAVLLVEDEYRTFRGKDNEHPFMETRRLLQVTLTRARHCACIVSPAKKSTFDLLGIR